MENTKYSERNPSFKMFFMKDEIISDSANNIQIIKLRNPQSKTKSHYILIPNKSPNLYEILQFNEPMRSWFIGDHLSSNGNIYITAPIDSIFIILPYLMEKCGEKYMPMDQLLDDDEFPQIIKFLDVIEKEQLLLVADEKIIGDLKAYKFNETKTLNWLSFKVNKLAKRLQNDNIHISSSTQCATFVKSDKLENIKLDNEIIRYCHGILSEYIPSKLSKTLETHLELEDIKTQIKRKSTTKLENGEPVKRSRRDIENTDSNSAKSKPVVTEKKVSAKEKARAKAAAGAKSITSFFKAK